MKARDIDKHDVEMLVEVSEELAEKYDSRASRLHDVAGLLNRHIPELAECEHGQLKGRCEHDPCELQDFESDHVVNRAVDVRDQCSEWFTLEEAINAHMFSAEDFAELTRLAWVGARVLDVAPHAAEA